MHRGLQGFIRLRLTFIRLRLTFSWSFQLLGVGAPESGDIPQHAFTKSHPGGSMAFHSCSMMLLSHSHGLKESKLKGLRCTRMLQGSAVLIEVLLKV